MDAVELPLPAAVTVSKLMGSDGCGGSGVTVEASPSTDTYTSLLSKKDEKHNVNASEPAFWNEMHVDFSRHSSFQDKDSTKNHKIGSTTNSMYLAAHPDAKQSQRKPGKVARSNGNCSRRSRVTQMEVPLSESGIVDINGLTKELGSCHEKGNIAERMQTAKQKSNLNGKRADKRNGKIPKSKCDSFSVKAGLSSFSSSAGGNNILGVYGSKPDICDFTKQMDELSLNELLDGSYKFPTFDKVTVKKAANLNGSISHLVREACSVLRFQRPTQSQNMAEVDSTHLQKVSSCLVSSGSSGASRSDDDKGDVADLSSCEKIQDSCSELLPPVTVLDFPLHRPKEILDRLSLPPPKDLDTLLIDGMKPTSASKSNPELRVGKPVHCRGGLPTFPWSHVSGGYSKSNLDAVKLTTNRSTCQGRWFKIANYTISLEDPTGFLADFESLTYDQSLVPSVCQKPVPTESGNPPWTSVSFTSPEQGFASSATCSMISQLPAGHSPKVLAAAQTLCDIAAHSFKQDPSGMARWPNKPSQKTMKASKLKSDEKSENVFATPKSRVPPDNLVNEMVPSKKLRPSVNNEKTDDLRHANSSTKVPLHWSTPRSSRSSPCKPHRDSLLETKQYDTNTSKKLFIMPPPTRVSNKPPKMRKVMPTDWNRPFRKMD